MNAESVRAVIQDSQQFQAACEKEAKEKRELVRMLSPYPACQSPADGGTQEGYESLRTRQVGDESPTTVPAGTGETLSLDFLSAAIDQAISYAEANLKANQEFSMCLRGRGSDPECALSLAHADNILRPCVGLARKNLAMGFNKQFFTSSLGVFDLNRDLDEMGSGRGAQWAPLTPAELADVDRGLRRMREATERHLDIEKAKPLASRPNIDQLRRRILFQNRAVREFPTNEELAKHPDRAEEHICGYRKYEGNYQRYRSILDTYPILSYVKGPYRSEDEFDVRQCTGRSEEACQKLRERFKQQILSDSRADLAQAVDRLTQNAQAVLRRLTEQKARLEASKSQCMRAQGLRTNDPLGFDPSKCDLDANLLGFMGPENEGVINLLLEAVPAYCGVATSMQEAYGKQQFRQELALFGPIAVVGIGASVVSLPAWAPPLLVGAGIGVTGYSLSRSEQRLAEAEQRARYSMRMDEGSMSSSELDRLRDETRMEWLMSPTALIGGGVIVKGGLSLVRRGGARIMSSQIQQSGRARLAELLQQRRSRPRR